ncbi:glycosyltransferase family 2 protein [Pseudothauera nasutitermitis]|uniref:Glycosyltransferase family 2 protein n=1 Tax=Pseudothauera nasutitermitis TaxID=2565930 RepID=A0A4S4AZR7_9RHOO|nr:glycosyltransferase family 2 protein [Pseudothauera nasutitermitis]
MRQDKSGRECPPCEGLPPLVSVRIHNYNYGRFLRQCFESVLAQTYPNFEISFSDNASEDESWKIALEYQRRHPDRVSIARNRQNFGPDANIVNCVFQSSGKYTVQMCSDDVMAPDFIETCVRTLEAHPDCAFAMVHRGIIDGDGEPRTEPPFYDRSCIIPGHEQAAVYMMAAINPSISQVMYVSAREAAHRVDFSKVLAGRWYGARIMDFNLCCDYDVAYIDRPLLYHRLHGANDSHAAASNLMEVIGPYLLHLQFAEIARTRGMHGVLENLDRSTEKLGQLCLRYSTRALVEGFSEVAERYFHLAQALSPRVAEEPAFAALGKFWHADEDERQGILDALKNSENLVERAISYPPPAGSRSIGAQALSRNPGAEA